MRLQDAFLREWIQQKVQMATSRSMRTFMAELIRRFIRNDSST